MNTSYKIKKEGKKMKQKTNLKILLVLAIIIIATLIFDSNIVKAETYNNFKYIINANEIEITGLVDNNITEIIIPDTINGYKVTSIGKNAFSNYTKLINVEISDNVISIGEYAFENCTSLKNIKLPNKLTTLSHAILYNCTSLTNLQIPDSVTKIGNFAISGCSNLTKLEIPKNVTEMENSAFTRCTNLKEVKVKKGASVIGDYAFSLCKNLKKVEIPGSVNSIGKNTFSDYASDAILMVEKGSYAEKYAMDNNMKFKYDENNVCIQDCQRGVKNDFAYTGLEIMPDVNIYDNSNNHYKLIKDVDYILEYSNNVNIGTATIKIKGKSNYTGMTILTFEIRERNIIDEIIDLIPDTIELNIPEIEYEKSGEEVRKNIEKILKNNNIEYEVNDYQIILKEKVNNNNIVISCGGSILHFGNDNFYKGSISIQNMKKDIKLVYNNSQKHDKNDEQYINNLKLISPKYYEVGLEFLSKNSEDAWKEFFNLQQQYYTKQINDTSIEVKVDSGSGNGGINIVIGEGGTWIGLFKNGILYDIREVGSKRSVPVINVPSSIEESNINNYVIKQILKYNKNLGENVVSIEKGTKELYDLGIDIEDGYTIKFNSNAEDAFGEGAIIIRKEKNMETTDKTTNIKLDTTTDIVPSNIVLETKEIKEEKILNEVKENLKDISDKFITYDITLKSNGVAIQPKGKVKISIPIPENFDKTKIVVFRIENNGTKVKYDTKIEGNFAIIETDHFSTYVLAENNIVTNNTDIQDEQNTNKEEKDETPKTGTIDIINYALITMTLAGIGIVVLKKNLK